MYKSNKIISKFAKKLLKYMIMFKGILTFLALNYRDALLSTLYFVVLGIHIPKIRSIGVNISHKNLLSKK